MIAKSEGPDSDGKVSAALTGAIATFTALLTGFGAGAGLIGGTLRNHPSSMALAFGFVSLVVFCGLIARLHQTKTFRWLFVGALSFLIGSGFAIHGIGNTASGPSRPTANASVKFTDGKVDFTGVAKASGLKKADQLIVTVSKVSEPDEVKQEEITRNVSGPDAEGVAEIKPEFVLDPGTYILKLEARVYGEAHPGADQNFDCQGRLVDTNGTMMPNKDKVSVLNACASVDLSVVSPSPSPGPSPT